MTSVSAPTVVKLCHEQSQPRSRRWAHRLATPVLLKHQVILLHVQLSCAYSGKSARVKRRITIKHTQKEKAPPSGLFEQKGQYLFILYWQGIWNKYAEIYIYIVEGNIAIWQHCTLYTSCVCKWHQYQSIYMAPSDIKLSLQAEYYFILNTSRTLTIPVCFLLIQDHQILPF